MESEHSTDFVDQVAYRLIEHLVRAHAQIERITLFRYPSVPTLQARAALNESEKQLIERALELRSTSKMPFWDSVMLSTFSAPGDFPNIFQAAQYHQPPFELIKVDRHAIERGELSNIRKQTVEKVGVALSSEVELSDSTRAHIPLLDFHCPQTAENIKTVIQVAEQLLPEGFAILESGKSFHAYGLDLYSPSRFDVFLKRCLFFSPIVDRAYIAHQLLEGRAALRLFRGLGEKPEPKIVYFRDR